MKPRNTNGQYTWTTGKKRRGWPAKNNSSPDVRIVLDHNYVIGHFHDENQENCDLCCPGFSSPQFTTNIFIWEFRKHFKIYCVNASWILVAMIDSLGKPQNE